MKMNHKCARAVAAILGTHAAAAVYAAGPAEASAGGIEEIGDVPPDIDVDQALDPVDERMRLSWHRHRRTAAYRLASWELRRSVISMQPGAWVTQKSGRTCAITACGVTPQAQNTGSSSLLTGTASP